MTPHLQEFLQTAKQTLLRQLNAPVWMILLVSLCLISLVFANYTVWDLPVAVIDQDRTVSSHFITRQINASPKMDTIIYDNLNQAKNDLHWRKLFAVIIIPQDFEKHFLSGKTASISIYGDATSRLANGQIQQAISAIYQDLSTQRNQQLLYAQGFSQDQASVVMSPMKSTITDLYNPGINFAAITLPGLLIMMMQQSLLMTSTLTSIGLYIAHNNKTPFHIHLGAMTGLIPIWLFLTIALLVFWPAMMGFRQTAPISELLILVFPFIFAVIAMGVFIMQCLRSVELVFLTLTFIPIPVFYFSGAIWPSSSMPVPIWFLSQLLPSTWATKMLAGTNQLNLPISDVWTEVLMLLALAVFYSMLAIIVSRIRDYGLTALSWRKL
ncbi:ABC transporter permease [Entomomonas asaccharolytica]|uniref:ABC transporter permease n=1 Tax=Entomomonas asaccharolytica TaxID=2785331 RepID=A0A974NEI8_9GAMM|nr:ABC transporter permease [Entomomonas asaccharolytica]QQP85228.1 ABC transporter permease [Entomomonas asaccharolytica]